MTIVEKKSKRKATAIKNLVDTGEYSPSYALMIAEELNDEGKLLDVDYEPLAEYLEELINKPMQDIVETVLDEIQNNETDNTQEENVIEGE